MDVFDLIKYYSQIDFNKNYGELLYNLLQVVILEDNENYEKYDAEKEYNKDDIVYVRNIRTNILYKSLLDNNTEDLNNENAWVKIDYKVITKEQFTTDREFVRAILPNSLKKIICECKDEPKKEFLKKVIGLFFGCYYYNYYNLENQNPNGSIVSSLHIGIQSSSYAVPDYALKEDNIFYMNPFGRQILALKDKLLINEPFKLINIDLNDLEINKDNGKII